jgi:small-conductance mechanosensitive channel
MHRAIFFGALGALSLGLLLLALRPRDRASVRNMLVVLFACVLLDLAGLGVERLKYASAAKVLTTLAAFGVGAVIIRLGGALLFRSMLPAVRLEMPRIVEDLVTTAVGVGWLMFWLTAAGLDPASLLTTSAVITAVLAFSMQDTLGNVLGGVVLQLDDSLRVGDWVEFENIRGQVVDVRWRHTAVETRNRETVVVPNGWLVKNRFTVIGSRNDPRVKWRRWVWFNIEASAPPGRVCQVLEDAINHAEIAAVLRDPAPSAVLMEPGASFSRYALRYWMSNPRADDPTDSLVRVHALAALARNHIRLGINLEERVLIDAGDDRRSAHEAAELERRKRALAGIELFATLSDAERDTLAQRMVVAPFVAGDTITRQGAVAHWLYLIASGDADVWADSDTGRVHIATLGAGSVFGEMGMMTGEPRRASVTAKTDVECFRIDKESFESILRARPDIAEDISKVIAKRRAELDTAREAAGAKPIGTQQDAILARIRSFFGLEA